ncbi:GDP-mannose-dependent alpha-(1-6)-phosphatidylinositol monomannoside mannosyltransferase [Pirellulimonas nuda]|uniref:GDP-mannose-dependent alpha-(1-6)-phosphatidylinositol monomannoside mannosyltransferase n=1 Tax=Pirellulimonas nuda TaxID=2528009 RepID=A0A518D7C8_9BACT|nr:glycosyltransferase [Pirellulimonas nuda]QDU87390.1 GDP-mannose-dependent alpha-(1-6)-phosphatidylinositol monomannoside mannosyltransferase [Pirellulimonas nuda]
MRITFFVYRLQRDRLMTTEFYRQDVEILRSLGHEVHIATRLREVPKQTDVVFLWWWNWLWLVGPVLKLRGLPIVVTGSLEPDIYEQKPWYYRLLVRAGLRFADRSVFVSQYMIDRLSAMMPLKDPLYCPHIVLDAYRPAGAENTRALPNVIFNVCWKTKNNVRRKMQPELIEAFALLRRDLPNAQLLLAGEPVDGQAALERRCAELGLGESVQFLGKISREEKISYMQRCGAYFQCSRHEGFGLALAEAMACGAPVVVNHNTAIPEVVGDCGYYVDDESPASIAKSLKRALTQPAEAQALGARAAARIDSEFRFDRRRTFLAAVLDGVHPEAHAIEPARRAA